MSQETKTPETEKPVVQRPLPKVKSHVKGGPARRMENFGDPIGNYNI